MATRYSIESLRTCAAALMTATGFPGEVAAIVAERLVDADAMGHDTHGLQLLGPYLDDAAAGRMTLEGEPEVIADRPAAVTWDGRRLSGVWLTEMAVGLAIERARACGQATVAIRRSHHIACLATFLPTATRAGMMVTIASSDPAVVSVAPHGGTKPLYTPNPIAVGIPTKGDPILIDISASIMSARPKPLWPYSTPPMGRIEPGGSASVTAGSSLGRPSASR